MASVGLLYLVYAVVLVLGGLFGYVKTRSTASLIAGVASAVVLIIATVFAPHHPRVTLGLGAVVSAALLVVFVRRYAVTRKAMPAIPIIVLSLVVLGYRWRGC